MRGDLEQISLSDVFQTLSLSKMDGLLKVSNVLEQRTLYFHDGLVQDLVFGRAEMRRIGERLISAGLVTQEQVRVALTKQRESGAAIGKILVDAGAADQEAIDEVVHYQVAEDLYGLFTWKSGIFEFFKGPPRDATALERLQTVPSFDANGVLLEVARRSDEWDVILKALRTVDEVLLPAKGGDAPGLEGNAAAVMAVLDGTRSVRELTDQTNLGLFDCARALRGLHAHGLVEHASADEMLAVAEMQHQRGDTRRARVTLRTLIARREAMTLPAARALAAALERCGEPRLASQCLWRKAQELVPVDEALPLAREACRLDKRSSAVLEYLLQLLRKRGDSGDSDEIMQVTSDLADALLAEGREEAALAVVDDLQQTASDLTGVLGRKARLLQRLGRAAEAVTELVRLAEILKRDRRREELIRVYEQIMMLDHHRRDIARALAILRSSKLARRVRWAAAILVAAGLVGGGVGYLRQQEREERLLAVVGRIQAEIDAGRTDVVPRQLEQAIAAFGDRPELEHLGAELNRVNRERVEAAQQQRQVELRQQEDRAGALLQQGLVDEALAIYRELLQTREFKSGMRALAKARIDDVREELDDLVVRLPLHMPEPLRTTLTSPQRKAVLAALDEHFRADDRRLAQNVAGAKDTATLVEFIGAEAHGRMLRTTQALLALFAEADRRRAEYLAAEERSAFAALLQPVYVAAREHERRLEFRQAHTAYRRLVEEYPDEDELKARFREMEARYRAILASLDDIAAATQRGDHDRAVTALRAMRQAEPALPFERLVSLPLRIETLPPGAAVSVDGVAAGRSPLLTSCPPGRATRVKVELAEYGVEEATVDLGEVGALRLVLSKLPKWVTRVHGAVERRPLCDGDGRTFLVDRSGTVTAVDLNAGSILWESPTDDVSGLLPSPVLCGQQLIVTSFDDPGLLRCLDVRTGRLQWQREGLPCEGAPVLVGDVLVLATRRGETVGLQRREDGSWHERYRGRLRGDTRLDLAADGRHVFAAAAGGWVSCIAAADGREIWQQKLSGEVTASPCVAPGVVLAVTDDGALSALAAADGQVLWRQRGLGELNLAPTWSGPRAVVVGEQRVSTFALADGAPGPYFDGNGQWSSAPTLILGRLCVGERSGGVVVLDPETLEVRYHLRGQRAHIAPLAVDASGRVVAAFEDGTLQGFERLP